MTDPRREISDGGSRAQPRLSKKQLGQYGEELAERLLLEQDYRIVARNWRCRSGELDLIAEKQGILVFVEVRTRVTAAGSGLAKESIDMRKRTKVRELAQFYLRKHRLDEQRVRFDVIAVECAAAGGDPVIEHLEAAF